MKLVERFASTSSTEVVSDPWNSGTQFEIVADTDPAYRTAQQEALKRNPLMRQMMSLMTLGQRLRAAAEGAAPTKPKLRLVGAATVESAEEVRAANATAERREDDLTTRIQNTLMEAALKNEMSDSDLDALWSDNAAIVALLVRKVWEDGRVVASTHEEIVELLTSPAWVPSGLPYSGEPDEHGVTPGQTLGKALQQFLQAEGARFAREAAETKRKALGNSRPFLPGASAGGDGSKTTSAAS